MKIGIVVPVYNVAPYVRECLESIKNQTYTDFCCVMINDASTDDSADICIEYEVADKRFILLCNEKNIGLGLTRNVGIEYLIEKTECNRIAFIDSDDYVDRRYLEILNSAMECSGCQMAICHYTHTTPFRVSDNYLVIDSKDFYRKRGLYKTYPSNCASAKLFDISFFKTFSFSEKKHEDIWIIPKVTMSCEKIVLCDSEMYYYRYVATSLAHKHYTIDKIDRILGFQSCVDFCLNEKNGCEQHFLSCMFAAINDQKQFLRKNRGGVYKR